VFALISIHCVTTVAQLVADGTTNTLANITTNITGDVIVGTNGSFTLLVLSDNALLTNSANGIISRNAAARSNEVHLVSPSARWLMNGTLIVGSNGASSTLIVSNGAFVRANAGQLGRSASGSNVVLVTGAGSLWSNVAGVSGVGVTVGVGGSGNQLIISNGGWVINANGAGTIGNSGSNNVARVTGVGSVWSNRFGLNINPIGVGSINNGLIIEDGGQVFNDDALIAGLNGSSNSFALVTGSGSIWINRDLHIGASTYPGLVVSNGGVVLSANSYVGNTNQLQVTGSGSLWSNRNDLALAARRNTLSVSNGGWLVNGNGYVGGLTGGDVTASNNLVVITGAGSTWSNWANVFLGFAGQGNQLMLSNGATMSASNVFVGFNSSSLANRITVDGGTLRVTNTGGTAKLDVRRGTNFLEGVFGSVEVDQLIVTNTGSSRFVFNRGMLTAGKSTVNNGLLFSVGNGTGTATFNLVGNGAHTFANGIRVFANAVLTGSGSIDGVLTVSSGGTLRPGAPIGKIVLFDSPLLAGSVTMEISKNGSALTNDMVQVGVPLTYGGSLTVMNSGPTALAPGDSFRLFSALSFSGAFSSVTLPSLSGGLTWTNKLLVNGSIEVLGVPPTVQTLAASALSLTNVTLNGFANPRGSSTFAWFEWGPSTNYGNTTPLQALGNGTNNTSFSEVLTGLVAGVTYHFRAVGSNAIGIVFGNDLTFPNLTFQAYLKASNTGSNDVFGFAVALSDNTLVVGGRFESSDATGVNGDQNNDSAVGSGATYIFVRTGTNWTQQAYFKASNTESNDQFGTSVGISGDTVVAGARFESSSATGVNGNGGDNGAPNAGAAYVFVRNGTNWAQQAYLKASNTGAGDTFGQRSAMSDDTIVVGAPLESSNATGVNGDGSNDSALNSGAAYVFVRNGTNWVQQAYVKASNTGAGDMFGSWVAIHGDTLVVGASQEDSSALGVNGDQNNNTGTNSGAVYVFVRNGTNWTQQAYLKASNTGSGDEFGLPVGISGDTIIVGARLEASVSSGVNGDQLNDDGVIAGAVYVFTRIGTNWTQQAYLKPSNTKPLAGEQFGFHAAISGNTVVVGAVGEDSDALGVNGDQSNFNASTSGAAYVFVRSNTNWTQQAYLKASNTGIGDLFGNSVAVSDEMLVVAAREEDSNATGINGDGNNNSANNSGAAYVFDFPTTPVPLLSIAPNGASQVTLSWTPPTPGFVLQESLTLSPLSWSNSPSGKTNPIMLPAAEQTKFFRLFKP